jgi:AcrR family transcriptional regulator
MSSYNGGTRTRRNKRLGDNSIESGANGIELENVAGIQRTRILAATVVEVVERGAGNVTVSHVVARSGVSRRTFYELFADGEACFLAAFEDAVARVGGVVVPAYRAPLNWRERIRAGLISLLVLLGEEPALARLLIVESLAAGPKALERRARVLLALNRVVDRGREEAKAGMAPAAVTAEGAVGAVLAVLHGHLVSGGGGPLVELAGPLMSTIVLPYLGPVVARAELERSAPRVETHPPPRVASNPLHDLGMRLTYRTMRVLMAIATEPGSSNRILAEAAGIADQGQVSKLLARLRRAGLVENTGASTEHGGPNAWTLTDRGTEVHGAIAPVTSHA